MRRFYCLIILIVLVFAITLASASVSKSRSLEFTYTVSVSDVPPGTREVKIWIPYLSENAYQVIDEANITPENFSRITYDKKYNNKIIYCAFQSPKNSSLEVKANYKVKRYEYANNPAPASFSKSHTPDSPRNYLSADKWVTLSPRVRALAKEITKGKKTTIDKDRAIYKYVFNNVSYDKAIPGWGNGDTERVCVVRAGNCTDFHSLFISLVRASGIPAKFVMGIPLPHDKKEGEIPGYHCWAEFYDKKTGWIPVDISEAWKDKSKYNYYFGALTEDRLEFTHGRDIILEPAQNTEPLNYFFYPYVEVDGKIFTNVKTSFIFKDKS